MLKAIRSGIMLADKRGRSQGQYVCLNLDLYKAARSDHSKR